MIIFIYLLFIQMFQQSEQFCLLIILKSSVINFISLNEDWFCCWFKLQAPPRKYYQLLMIAFCELTELFACEIPCLCLLFLLNWSQICCSIPIQFAAQVMIFICMFDCKLHKTLFSHLFKCSRCKPLEMLHPMRPCVLMKVVA